MRTVKITQRKRMVPVPVVTRTPCRGTAVGARVRWEALDSGNNGAQDGLIRSGVAYGCPGLTYLFQKPALFGERFLRYNDAESRYRIGNSDFVRIKE